jgi:hypothetical protein
MFLRRRHLHLRPSIDDLTAVAIADQDNADAESMFWAILQCARFIERRGKLATGDA